jgi:hypothetical protein
VSTPVKIVDGSGTYTQAKVTTIGQVVTGHYAYDETKFNALGTAAAGYTFYSPKAGQQFVITGIIVAGNLAISANALATVVVFEASDEDVATEDKVLLQVGVTRLQTYGISSLNILVSEGAFVNAKTDDDDVFMTIMGYYVPA